MIYLLLALLFYAVIRLVEQNEENDLLKLANGSSLFKWCLWFFVVTLVLFEGFMFIETNRMMGLYMSGYPVNDSTCPSYEASTIAGASYNITNSAYTVPADVNITFFTDKFNVLKAGMMTTNATVQLQVWDGASWIPVYSDSDAGEWVYPVLHLPGGYALNNTALVRIYAPINVTSSDIVTIGYLEAYSLTTTRAYCPDTDDTGLIMTMHQLDFSMIDLLFTYWPEVAILTCLLMIFHYVGLWYERIYRRRE